MWVAHGASRRTPWADLGGLGGTGTKYDDDRGWAGSLQVDREEYYQGSG